MTGALLGIGLAIPEFTLGQARAAEMAAELTDLDPRRAHALSTLYAQSGVGVRRTALADAGMASLFRAADSAPDGPGTDERMAHYGRLAPPLAEQACRRCLDGAGVDAGRITHLVTVSCTGFAAPGVDIELIRRLGLRSTVQRTHIGFMGCHGAINGLRVAGALAASEPDALVLLCCVELCSLHFQHRPARGGVTANALFGDGAAACLVAPHENPHENPHDKTRGRALRLAAFGAAVLPDSLDDMAWRITDHGFEMALSARVPGALRERVPAWIDAWLGGLGVARADIRSWAIHPGGPRIVEAVRAALGLRPEQVAASLETLRTRGNMSSPTILFIIERMLKAGAPTPMVCLAFGPGLAGESLLIGGPEPG